MVVFSWQVVKRRDVLAVVVTLPIDGAPVMQRERLEDVDEDAPTEDRIFGSGQAPQQLIARPQND
jgi:hypothetical protein